MWTTLYLSFFIIVLSTLFGTILAVMRNGKNPILRWIASIYVEFVRNVPNLLWIFIIFLVFQLKSTAAGDYLIYGLHLSCLGGNHSWGTELYRPWSNRSRIVSRDLTTNKSLFTSSSHKLFVRCCHLSSLNL